VDGDAAALDGLDADAVTRQVDAYLAGIVATQVPEALKTVGVRVWLPPDGRRHDSDVSSLMLRAPDGHLVPLARVASVEHVTGQRS